MKKPLPAFGKKKRLKFRDSSLLYVGKTPLTDSLTWPDSLIKQAEPVSGYKKEKVLWP